MNIAALETKKPVSFREIRETKNSAIPYDYMTPPDGFMTGDEFERRVKERVTRFYKENGLL